MSTLHFFQTLLEVLAIGFIVWGYFNQDKLVSFENRIKAFFKRRKLTVKSSSSSYNSHCA